MEGAADIELAILDEERIHPEQARYDEGSPTDFNSPDDGPAGRVL